MLSSFIDYRRHHYARAKFEKGWPHFARCLWRNRSWQVENLWILLPHQLISSSTDRSNSICCSISNTRITTSCTSLCPSNTYSIGQYLSSFEAIFPQTTPTFNRSRKWRWTHCKRSDVRLFFSWLLFRFLKLFNKVFLVPLVSKSIVCWSILLVWKLT